MEEIHRARYVGRARSVHVLSGWATLPESPHVHQPGSSPNHIFMVLWRPYYTGMLDYIIDHWWLIQPLAPLFSLEIRGWDWNFQPSIQGWFLWHQASILRWFPNVILLPENQVHLLVGVKPKDTTKSKSRRRKDLLLAASKENTWDPS